jgi:hypothetical protein
VRGVLAPVLDHYAVGFRVMHGFASATAVYDVAQDDDGRELNVLYVGDYDPSGMYMSARDLPDRLSKYDGNHVLLTRIALTRGQVRGLPSFPASDKKDDKRYEWFVTNYGKRCWELDAMDPNDLRECVERCHCRVDRARGVGTLRDCQQGGAGVAQGRPAEVGQKLSSPAAPAPVVANSSIARSDIPSNPFEGKKIFA